MSGLENTIAFSKEKAEINRILEEVRAISKIDPMKAIHLCEHTYQTSHSLSYFEGIAQSLLQMGYACRIISNNDKALSCLSEALPIYTKLNDSEGICRTTNLMGIIYFYFSRYDTSLDYFLKSLEKAREIDNIFLEASVLNNIGEIYRELGEYKKALYYYNQSLELSKCSSNKHGEAMIYLNIGLIYYNNSQYDQALQSYNKGLILSQEINDAIFEADNYNKIGEAYIGLGNTTLARVYFIKSLKRFKNINNLFYRIPVLKNLGKYHFDLGNYAKGFSYLHRALKIANSIQSQKDIYQIHELLSKFHEKRGSYQKALQHYKTFQEIEKDVANKELIAQINTLTIQMELKQAQKQAEILKTKNIELERKSKEIRNKTKELRKVNRKLELMNKEMYKLEISRLTFLTNISHDLRTPMTSIQGYTEAILDGIINEPEQQKKYLKLIHNKILGLNKLTNELFELTKLEAKSIKLQCIKITVEDLLNIIYEKYKVDVEMAGISFEKNNSSLTKNYFLYVDFNRIERVFANLIYNAVKYTDPGGKIILAIDLGHNDSTPNEIIFQVIDSGSGITSEDLPNIFERFYMSSKSRNSNFGNSGLGLAIAKEIVQLHGGKIWAESTLTIGSVFSFSLPIHNSLK